MVAVHPPADAMYPMHKRGAAPPAVAHTYKRHLPPKCGGTETRERLEVTALRTLGWDIGPTGAAAAQRTQRRNKPRGGPASPAR